MLAKTHAAEDELVGKALEKVRQVAADPPNLSVEGRIVLGGLDAGLGLDDETEVVPSLGELERSYAINRTAHLGLQKSFDASGDWGSDIAPQSEPLTKTVTDKSDLEPRHKDGTEFEKCGEDSWRFEYQDGKMIRAHVDGPAFPGGLDFDADGNIVEEAA